MKKLDNWNEVEPVGNATSAPLQAGGYVGKITSVEDVADKMYLKITWDITEGEFKGNGASCMERNGFLPSPFTFIRSYKDSAIGFFKGFISSVEQSNPNYKWDFNEKTLVGKTIGCIVGEQEYRKNDGSIGTRLKTKKTVSAETIRGGNFKIPPKEVLKEEAPSAPVWSAMDTDDGDLPF